MRILQVSDGYPPVIGGVESYVENLSRALVGAGHEVMVATLATPGLAAREVVEGVEIRRLSGMTQKLPGAGHDPGHVFHPPAPDPPIVWQLQSLVRQFRPDVIHAHGWMMHSCLPLRRRNAALVVHLHEWGLSCVKKTMVTASGTCLLGPSLARCTTCAAEQYRGKARSGPLAVSLRIERPMYRRVDAFVAISTAVAASARQVVPHPERLYIVPTAVPDGLADLARRTPPPDWLPRTPFILFVGVLGPHKGVDVLLRAHAQSKSQLPLVMLGTIRSDTPVIDDGVVVRQDVPHDEVMVSWLHASIGVVPSLSEAFGQVTVECQSVGTPVIVSSVGGLVDIVTDGVNGLIVPPRDVDALALAIDRLADDPVLRSELGEAGRARAAEFTMSAVLPAIQKIYSQALATRGAESVEVLSE